MTINNNVRGTAAEPGFADNFLSLAMLTKVQIFSYLTFQDISSWVEVTRGYKGIKDAEELRQKYGNEPIDSYDLDKFRVKFDRLGTISVVVNSNDVWREVGKKIGFVATSCAEGQVRMDTISYLKRLFQDIRKRNERPDFVEQAFAPTRSSNTIQVDDESLLTLGLYRNYMRTIDHAGDKCIVFTKIVDNIDDTNLSDDMRNDILDTVEEVLTALDENSESLFSRSFLTEIDSWFYKYEFLTSLRTLDLGIDMVTHLPSGLFHLTSIRKLELGNNRISELTPSITELCQLTDFNLGRGLITELPANFSQLSQLTRLRLGNNPFKETPPQIGEMHQLRELYLIDIPMDHFPDFLTRLTNLTRLWIENPSKQSKQLHSLPENISLLSNLQDLRIDNQQLASLPKSFVSLTNLEMLSLAKNLLTTLPQGFSRLQKLDYLSLTANNFSTLPAELGKLIDLKVFELYANRLLFIPQEFSRLTNLNSLYIEIPLLGIPDYIRDLPNLRHGFRG